MRRAALPVALALAAMACGAATWLSWREPSPEGLTPRPAPATPVLSARRAPALLAGVAADARLRRDLDAVVADRALGPAANQLCLTVDAPDGRRLYSHRSSQALIPASNLKLLTAMAALDVLGKDTTLRTEVRAERPPEGGVVAGNLWMVGGGDPLLATGDYIASLTRPHAFTPLEALADRVVAAGVRRVDGAVVGDETRYDTQRYIPTWRPRYITNNEIGPQSALTVNDNFSSFRPLRIAAASPAASSASTLAHLLRMRGVVVVGTSAAGTAPATAPVVAAVESPPVSTIVEQLLRESDNMTAELLVKEVDRRSGGRGSTAAGVLVMRRTLERLGLPVDQFVAADGSGLDRGDRATCELLLRALERPGKDSALVRGLPVAARDGTLKERFEGTPLAGRVRAKTGSLAGVAGLTGFATSRAGDVSFSLVVNELPRDAVGTGLQARVSSVLIAYPNAPPATELGPRS